MLLEDIIMVRYSSFEVVFEAESSTQIYRAYVVWARRVLIVVIPLALWLASIGAVNAGNSV